MTAELEPENLVPLAFGFPMVARRRDDGRELLRLPGLDKHEDIALLEVVAGACPVPVDVFDVRDPELVQWSSDMPSAASTRAEQERVREERWMRELADLSDTDPQRAPRGWQQVDA